MIGWHYKSFDYNCHTYELKKKIFDAFLRKIRNRKTIVSNARILRCKWVPDNFYSCDFHVLPEH